MSKNVKVQLKCNNLAQTRAREKCLAVKNSRTNKLSNDICMHGNTFTDYAYSRYEKSRI